jgi:beta-glucosidase
LTGNDTITATVNVTNTGNRKGDEIVQLYIRDVVGSVSRPLKELKGFERISLLPGETKEVSFTITEDMLRFYDYNLDYVSEAGDFEVMIGPNSAVVEKSSFKLKK